MRKCAKFRYHLWKCKDHDTGQTLGMPHGQKLWRERLNYWGRAAGWVFDKTKDIGVKAAPLQKEKTGIFKKCLFMHKNATKCKIWHSLKITVFTFFIISPVIFGLQRRILSQIKALKILFWPCFIIFSLRINICIILSTFFLLTR